jgi:hypothetical protein
MKKIVLKLYVFLTLLGCSSVGAQNIDSMYTSASKYELIASPNPFDEEVTLTIHEGNKKLTSIRIFDLIGKEVAYIDLKNKSGSISYKLDFSQLRPGVYFCNVYSQDGIIETKKLFRTK